MTQKDIETRRLHHRVWSEDYTRFTLRIPKVLLKQIGEMKVKLGLRSRNLFVLEAIRHFIKRRRARTGVHGDISKDVT